MLVFSAARICAAKSEAARGRFGEALGHITLAHTAFGDELIIGFEGPRIALIALQAGDSEALDAALTKLEDVPRPDDRTARWIDAATAAREIKRGKAGGAERLFDAAARLRSDGLVVDAAQWLTELAVLLPPDDPMRDDTAAEAREIWSGLGAVSMLDQLERRMAQ